MPALEDDIEVENESKKTNIDSKKILIFLLPVLIVIGITFGLFYFFLSPDEDDTVNYQTVSLTDNNGVSTIIFYDLPEIAVLLQNEKNSSLRMKINIELASAENIPTIDAMFPRIRDMIISHTLALRPEEVSGSRGMYWLKEEFLQRINLLVAPIKVNNLNFKTFEFIENNQ